MNEPLFNITYGLYIITACEDGRDNGCIADTVEQVTSTPEQVSVCLNKNDYTCGMVERTGCFTASVISLDAKYELFKHFGFQSGRDVDKFADFKDVKRVNNGTLAITAGVNAFISVRVDRQIDLGTHMMFIGEVTEKESLSDTPSITYAYYRDNIKPTPQAETDARADGGTVVWRCPICGYEYVGEELPPDFECPLCLEPGSSFERIVI